MGNSITTETIVAYTHCPRKAYLLLTTNSPPPSHDYETLCRERCKAHRERFAARLLRDGDDVVRGEQEGFDAGHRYLVGMDLRSGDLLATCDVLARIDHDAPSGGYSYSPQVFAGTYSVSDLHKLGVSFAGHVLDLIQGGAPTSGVVVTLDGAVHKVELASRQREIAAALKEVRAMGDCDATAPPVILNRHCPLCPFRVECRAKAEADDDLSLLDRMTLKAIRRYHQKGIFTVNQLSYLFRPRRRRRGAVAVPVFKFELQALAIRTGKIYLQTPPALVRHPVELFLDIEGIPDEEYHYLFGLVFRRGEERIAHALWADSGEDEERIWSELRRLLDAEVGAPIVHYGSYEPRAVARMGRRYGSDVEGYLRRMVNLNERVYGRVYFPAKSNGLKDIGAFIGARWTEPDASGLQSLVWRHRWEESREEGLKDKLLRYNAEDCRALVMLFDELIRLGGTAASADPRVDLADNPKQVASEVGAEVHAQFAEILKSAHGKYDANRIKVGKSGRPKKTEEPVPVDGARRRQAYCRIRPTRADRNVAVARKRVCPFDKGRRLRPIGAPIERYQIDLEFSRKGCKKVVTRYTGTMAYCTKCHRYYVPPAIARLERRLFGYRLMAWVVYQRVILRLPYRVIVTVMEDLFGECTSKKTVARFVSELGARYRPCDERTLRRILESPFIHVDETRLSIQGTDQYVWVLTDGHCVVLRLTATRENTMVRELLADYQGVLVSDFYAGYDGIGCRQQKCLVHLIRDLNDDLWASPFNTEFEEFVLAARDLLLPIIKAVQGKPTKARQLARFLPTVDTFYARHVESASYKFDVTQKYQKRFERRASAHSYAARTIHTTLIQVYRQTISGYSGLHGRTL